MVGFSKSAESETKPGTWEEVITERKYFGDVTKDFRKSQSSDKIVRDVTIGNQFSILADPFAFENLEFMKYIKHLGIAWTIESIEVQYPRLIISVGGRWNGPNANETT